jgi:hypothetical protein
MVEEMRNMDKIQSVFIWEKLQKGHQINHGEVVKFLKGQLPVISEYLEQLTKRCDHIEKELKYFSKAIQVNRNNEKVLKKELERLGEKVEGEK